MARSSEHRETVIGVGKPSAHRYPSWREWKPVDWAVAALLVALGFALESVLPSRVWGLLGVAAFVSYFFLVSSRRRRAEKRPPGQSWTPPLRDPGSDS